MTELHNMSVPPRSVLNVQRAQLRGRRYRIAIGASAVNQVTGLDDAALTRCFREDGAACALALLNAGETQTSDAFLAEIARHRRDTNAPAALRQLCDAAVRRLRLPEGFGFFVEEAAQPGGRRLSGAAAIAILAARSGPLYLPGRFEPSLVMPAEVTLFFAFGSG